MLVRSALPSDPEFVSLAAQCEQARAEARELVTESRACALRLRRTRAQLSDATPGGGRFETAGSVAANSNVPAATPPVRRWADHVARPGSPMPSEEELVGAESLSLLRCQACGRTEECAPAERLRHTREGWPKCCGQVMAYFTQAEPPRADDTKVDRPPLPPS